MEEKKVSTKAAAPKAAVKKAAPKKAAVKKVAFEINAESVGFKAGDVYQALAAAEKPLSVAEIAKSAKIANDEALLGMGWLFKEGKIKDAEGKVTLA